MWRKIMDETSCTQLPGRFCQIQRLLTFEYPSAPSWAVYRHWIQFQSAHASGSFVYAHAEWRLCDQTHHKLQKDRSLFVAQIREVWNGRECKTENTHWWNSKNKHKALYSRFSSNLFCCWVVVLGLTAFSTPIFAPPLSEDFIASSDRWL